MKTVSLPDAQKSLASLAKEVLNGEWVVITVGAKKMVLHEVGVEEPVPMREKGYFQDCFDEESIALDNLAALHSPQRQVP